MAPETPHGRVRVGQVPLTRPSTFLRPALAPLVKDPSHFLGATICSSPSFLCPGPSVVMTFRPFLSLYMALAIGHDRSASSQVGRVCPMADSYAPQTQTGCLVPAAAAG